MPTKNIAVIGDRFVRTSQLLDTIRMVTRDSGYTLRFVTDEHDWPDSPMQRDSEINEYTGEYNRTIELLREAEIAAIHMAGINKKVLDGASQLQLIACARGGAVNVNLAAATQRNIMVSNAPGRNSQAVSEYTVALIISITRGLFFGYHELTATSKWRTDLYRYEIVGKELASQTVGLVGFGSIGQLTASLLNTFGTRIIAYDPYVGSEIFKKNKVECCELDVLLTQADVISLHARHKPGSTPLIGASELNRAGPSTYLIQTARSPLLDYEALAQALVEGKIAGAAIDVFPNEPLPKGHPLFSSPNVVLTPHIAGASRGSAHRGSLMAAQSITAYLNQQSIPYLLS